MVRISRSNGHSSKGGKYRALTRNDLAAFDQEAKHLILEAVDAGCVGRISSKSHCILRSNTGSTVSIPRNMTSPNRTAQNVRADIKRLLAEQQPQRTKGTGAPSEVDRAPERTTVAQALTAFGSDFNRWFDNHPNGLPADAQILVTFGDRGQPDFQLIEPEPLPAADETEEEPEKDPLETSDTPIDRADPTTRRERA